MTNKSLWKLYIEYLKDHNPQILLQTYSKYCRFWLNDIQMRMEYENQVKIHGPVEVAWTNEFTPSEEISLVQRVRNMFSAIKPPEFHVKPFEKSSDYFYGMMCDYSLMHKNRDRLKYILPEKIIKANSIRYTKENMIFQQFPYCSTMINFILKNANSNILQKLFNSCKKFFPRKSIPVCYKLTLQDSCHPLKAVTYFQESLIIGGENPSTIFDGKNLAIRSRILVSSKNSPKMLSSFIPKIFRCDAKFIEIYGQKLTEKEFEFLTKNGTVEELILINVSIMDEDENSMPLEDILKMVLSVRSVEISNSNLYTFQTAKVLSELPFKNKIQRFFLWEVNVLFDLDDFSKFIEKNAATNCKFKIIFMRQISGDFKNEFLKAMNETISKKWTHPYFHPVIIPQKPLVLLTPVEGAHFVEMDPTWPYGS